MEIKKGLDFYPTRGSEDAKTIKVNPLTAEDAKIKTTRSQKAAKFMDWAIMVSIMALFFGLPVFFAGITFQGIAFEKQIYFYFWVLIGLIAWVSKGVILGEMKIRRTPLDIPILIFLFVYLLSAVFSVDRWHSFWGFFGDPSRGLMNAFAVAVAYYLIISNFTETRLKWILGSIAASSFAVSVWSALAVLGIQFLPAKISQIAPFSLIGSVSGLTMFLSLAVPLIVTAIFKLRASANLNAANKNILTLVLIITLGIQLFLLLALNAYVPWPALLIGLGFFLIYILSRIVRPAENWTWLPMIVFVAAFAISLIGSSRIAKINLPVEVSPAYRLSAQISWESLKDKFALGSGPATYGYDFSLHRPQEFNLNALYNLRFYQGSGLAAEVAPTTGALGAVSFILIILTFLGTSIYLLTRDKEKNKIFSLGFVSSALIFQIGAVLGRTEGSLVLIGSLLGSVALAILLREGNAEERAINLSLKTSPKFALALAFVFMVVSAGVVFVFVFLGKAFVADAKAGSAAREAQISEPGSVSKLINAINLNGKEGRYCTRLAQEYMVLANNEAIKPEKERNVELIRDFLSNSIFFAVRGRDLMKNDVLAAEVLAQVYENAGLYVADSLNMADESYRRTRELEPQNPNFDVKLGQIKMAVAAAKQQEEEKKQLVAEAGDFFQKAVDKKGDLAPAYYQLALARESLGESGQAIDIMGKAVMLDQNNITYLFNLGRLYQTRGEKEDNELAERIFKRVLGVNDKEINTHFSLGLLYEKTQRKNEAINEYKTVLDLLPAESADVRERIEKMINNIESGASNIPDNLKGANEEQVPLQPAEGTREKDVQPAEQPAG